MLYVPEGFAHGFQTLEDDTEVFYQMSAYYAPDHARGVRWNDPAFGIRWPEAERTISERDRALSGLPGLRTTRDADRGRAGGSGPRTRRAPPCCAACEDLYPLCRSITGDGLRQTLRLCRGDVPLALREVPSGTEVLDWTVPKEWSIRDAYIKNSQGDRIVDFRRSNLHVVNYSTPVTGSDVTDRAAAAHLHTLPDSTGLGAVPHVVLSRDLGLLPQSPPDDVPA